MRGASAPARNGKRPAPRATPLGSRDRQPPSAARSRRRRRRAPSYALTPSTRSLTPRPRTSPAPGGTPFAPRSERAEGAQGPHDLFAAIRRRSGGGGELAPRARRVASTRRPQRRTGGETRWPERLTFEGGPRGQGASPRPARALTGLRVGGHHVGADAPSRGGSPFAERMRTRASPARRGRSWPPPSRPSCSPQPGRPRGELDRAGRYAAGPRQVRICDRFSTHSTPG